MDRVLANVKRKGYKYRLYWTSYIMYTPYQEADDRYDAMYKLFVFDPDGQSIQIIGFLFDTSITKQPPIYSHQWCSVPCPDNEQMGQFDANKVYIADNSDLISQIITGDIVVETMESPSKHRVHHAMWIRLTLLAVVVIGFMILGLCLYRYCKCFKIHKQQTVDEQTQLLLP